MKITSVMCVCEARLNGSGRFHGQRYACKIPGFVDRTLRNTCTDHRCVIIYFLIKRVLRPMLPYNFLLIFLVKNNPQQ